MKEAIPDSNVIARTEHKGTKLKQIKTMMFLQERKQHYVRNQSLMDQYGN